MAREIARKNSHSRTCHGKGCFKLFGVQLLDQDQCLTKSASFGNLQTLSANPNNSHGDDENEEYLSDGQVHCKRAKTAIERKKGKPWNEEEHMNFLAGLNLLGRGDWIGISNEFVPTRTPTQVASHAQKYFVRQALSDKKNRRPSIFDIPYSESAPTLPKVSLPLISEKPAAITSSQVNAPPSSVMPLKTSFEMPMQANNSDQIAIQFPNYPATPSVCWYEKNAWKPEFLLFTQLQTPCNGQNFGGFQAKNYQKPGFLYMPPSATVTTHSHSSGIPSPPLSFQDATRTFKRASTT